MPRLPRSQRRRLDLRSGSEGLGKRFDYAEFSGIVIGGRENKQAGNDSVMPAFADNKNAMCYLDDIYVYLRARSTEAVGRGRPEKKEDKPATFADAEAKCMSAK